MTNGAEYAFCPKCGGWTAWMAVSDPDEAVCDWTVDPHRLITRGEMMEEFKRDHRAKGEVVEFYSDGNRPEACECLMGATP